MKKHSFAVVSVLLITITAAGILAGCDSNKKPYKDAEALLNNGLYLEAAAVSAVQRVSRLWGSFVGLVD